MHLCSTKKKIGKYVDIIGTKTFKICEIANLHYTTLIKYNRLCVYMA